MSTITHTYSSGGTVQRYQNFQHGFTQLKDLSIQADPDTGFNNAVNGCANVVSAIRTCIGIVTTIVGFGSTAGITTTYPGNAGYGITSITGITSAVYDNTTGQTTLVSPNLEEHAAKHVDHALGAVFHLGIEQVDTHVAALHKGVGHAQGNNHGVVKLELFGPPA